MRLFKNTLILISAILLAISSVAQGRYPNNIEEVLKQTKSNCSELEKAIAHFSKKEDSLKLKAVYFLIANMDIHYAEDYYWDWIAVNGTGDGLGITVSIPDMSAFSDVLSLRLVGWNGTQWIDLSGGPAASNNTENSTLSGTMVPGITAIGIGKNPTTIVLPLAVNSFAGIILSCQAKLQWNVSTEINSDHYEVEYSIDGTAFSSIGTVASQNNTTGGTYNYTFANLIKDANFFRIKALDKQGHTVYSDVIKLNNNCGSGPRIVISPNPTSDHIYITGMQGKNTVLILDASGRKLIQLVTEQYAEHINLKAFAKGTYIVRIINDNGTVTIEKIIKR